ncbi:MAG TPA: choice-of-anchor C family protein [Streptosporangiaceae bacterium]|nr:choice-of-anchor C family protein [Streptosporangiaceae bacterium]
MNGSFEDPSIGQGVVEYDDGSTDITGWTVGGNSVDLVDESYWSAEDGNQSVDLSGSAPGSVSQTVSTTPGANYTLTWWMAGNTNCGQPVKTMNVSWNGTLIAAPTFDTTGDSSTSMGWVQHQINVTATGASSAVEFADATPDMSQCGAALDNVSLVAAEVAAPSFTEDSPPVEALEGSAYSAIFFASGVPTYGLVGAPSWLTITPSGAVTGVPPAGTTSFSYSVSASNADGDAVAGPYTVTVQTAAAVTGTVVDGGIAATPVAGASVQACVTGGGECQQATTASGGTYSVNAPVGSSIVLSAYPHPGTGDFATSTAPLTVPASGIQGETISLDGIAPLSSGLEINGTPAPTVYWANPSNATITGCADGFGFLSIDGQNTQTGLYDVNVVPLVESPLGSGSYAATIPPQEPIHGPVDIQSSIVCPPQSSVSPDSGTAAGGNTVVLTGSGFTGVTGVSFGGISAESFTVAADGAIEAVAPAGTGTVPVTVSVGASTTVVGQYTYVAITSVSPAAGPSAGGTPVVITGTGLGSAIAVYFGTSGADFTQVSDTEIDAVSPPGSGTQDITVETGFGGTTPKVAADQFTYSGSTTAASAVAGPAPLAVSAVRETQSAGASSRALATGAGGILSSLFNYISLHPQDTAEALRLDETAADDAVQTISPSCEHLNEAESAFLAEIGSPAIGFAANLAAGFVYAAAEGIPAFAALGTALGPFVLIAASIYLSYELQSYISGKVSAFNATHAPACAQSDALVDPSGTVLDTNGNPVSGATVTILRSDTSAGPFTPVNVSAPGIEPATNPETTAADGVFHWDVDSGWYEIQASASGCTDPADSSQPAATVGPYPVPPPQVGLTVTLACSNEPPPPAPTVESLSESTGPAAGGTTLTVLGSGFTPTSTVKFGTAAALSVTYLSPQALTVTSPPGSGLVDVTVQNAGTSSGTSAADQFFYGSPPAVTGLSPSSGPANGGTKVTISGTGFTGATAVGFGGVPATSFTVVSATQIQATAPAQPAGTVDVSVVTQAGGSAQVTADQYAYHSVSTGPAIDGEATAKGKTTVAARLTAAASGDLVVAFVAADGPAGAKQRAKVSGGGLTWALAKRTNARNGTAEVWVAHASGALSRARITSTLARGGFGEALTVVAFRHAPGTGATASASGRTGAPSGSLTTTSPNSWVFAVGIDGTASIPRTLGAGQTLVSQATDRAGDTYWVQSRSALTPAAGTTVTINDTAPKRDMWNLTLIEIT